MEGIAGEVVDDNKENAIGVALEFAVEKDGGIQEMDAMDPLELQEKDMYALTVKYLVV